MNTLKTIAISLSALTLSGCAGLVVAGVAGGTVGTIAMQDGGVSGFISDKKLSSDIYKVADKILGDHINDITYLVHEGRVLIGGHLPTAETHLNLITELWKVKGVFDVYDKLEVGKAPDVSKYRSDTALTSRARSVLLRTKSVSSLNYSITTLNATIYVLGVAQSELEKKLVEAALKNVSGARKAVVAICTIPAI